MSRQKIIRACTHADLKPEHYDKWYNNFQPWYPCINDPYPYRNCELANHFTGNVPELETVNAGWHRRFGVAIQRCVWRLAVASRGWVVAAVVWGSLFGDVCTSLSGVQHCQGLQCFYSVCPCVRGEVLLCDDVCFVMLCAWKASVYLSKRINSSLLTKIFND